jgi:hypothetical protein
MLTYKVAAKYQKGPETVVAKFDKLGEAKAFIMNKLSDDINLKVTVIYNLYELGELVATFDQSQASGNDDAGGGGQQQSSGQRFSPNPLQTNLRPNLPPSSFINDDDIKK